MAACHRLGAYPVGVEPSHIIQVTNQGIIEAFGRPLPLVRADGRALPFKTGSFDVVISVGVLEHITEPEALVEEMTRVLKPKGTIILYFGPHSWWRFAQSPNHRSIVSTYWTSQDAENKMRALGLAKSKRVWTDVVDYRFRNDSFTNGKASLYGKVARLLQENAKKTLVRKTVVMVCKSFEMASFPRNVGLISTKLLNEPLQAGTVMPDYSNIQGMIDNLICPTCKNELEHNIIQKKESQSLDGLLYCSECKKRYQIVNGIPQFLSAE